MPNLIIESKRCRVEDEDDVGLLWALNRELAYEVQGAQFTRAYKVGYMDPFKGEFVTWDGKNRFLADDLSFPGGLQQRVVDFYKKLNRPLTVIDNRPPKSCGMSIDVLSTLNKMGKLPRPYQLQAMEATRTSDRGIIRIPTGGGKTLVATLITADIGKKTIVYVIGKDLLHQLHGFFKKVFDGANIGIIGDGKCEIGDINVASVWTVGQVFGLKQGEIVLSENDEETAPEPEHYSKIRNLLTEAKTHIIDECHAAACETIQTIVHNINPEHIYGMSASPWRDDGADLLIECVLGHKIIDVDASYLIKNNWLVKPFIKFIRVPPYNVKLKKQYQTVYKNYIVENEVRNGLVIQSAVKMVDRGYKPLVLFNSIKHGKILEDMLSKKIRCTLLSGKDKISVREQAKYDIENGNIDAIIASKIFDIGVDIPVLSGLVVAGSGKSSVRALQRIGRVIRPSPAKKQAVVADFVDDAHYLKKHSQARKKIYEEEKGFDVQWPSL